MVRKSVPKDELWDTEVNPVALNEKVLLKPTSVYVHRVTGLGLNAGEKINPERLTESPAVPRYEPEGEKVTPPVKLVTPVAVAVGAFKETLAVMEMPPVSEAAVARWRPIPATISATAILSVSGFFMN